MGRLTEPLIERAVEYLRFGNWPMSQISLEAILETLDEDGQAKISPAVEAFNGRDFMRCADLLLCVIPVI